MAFAVFLLLSGLWCAELALFGVARGPLTVIGAGLLAACALVLSRLAIVPIHQTGPTRERVQSPPPGPHRVVSTRVPRHSVTFPR